MCLWCSQFFHHGFQFAQIEETILADIVSEITAMENQLISFEINNIAKLFGYEKRFV